MPTKLLRNNNVCTTNYSGAVPYIEKKEWKEYSDTIYKILWWIGIVSSSVALYFFFKYLFGG
jgi:hypothetical protein